MTLSRLKMLVRIRLILWLVILVFTGGSALAQQPPWKRRGRRRKCYFDSSPQQAAVYIENESHGIACYTPCSLYLPYKQTFEVVLKKPGFQDHKAQITVARSRRDRKFNYVLKREILPGILDVQAGPGNTALGASILVNGMSVGTVPSQIKLKPGRHQVEVQKAGFKSWSRWVSLSQQQTYTLVVILEPKAKPKGAILVTSDPAGADVYLDGKRVDTTPTIITGVTPGDHTVEIRKGGISVWKQVVSVQAKARVKVHAVLKKPKPRPSDRVGSLRVLSNVPKADVYVDGEYKGAAPVTVQNLLPGDHHVEVKAKGYLPKEMRVKIVALQQSLIKLDLEVQPVENPVGTLRVQSEVPGAIVFLDGAAIGKAPVEKKDIPIGEHIVVVRKDGYKDYKVTVKIRKKEVEVVTAQLKAVGIIKVVTKVGGADVLIDSAPIGKTPIQAYEMEAGEYTLEVRRPGKWVPYRETFRIKGGEHKNFAIELLRARKGPSPVEIEAIKRGLSSFGARTIPAGNFIADVSTGWPYIVDAKLTVGAWKRGFFGIDAGISFRSLFAYMNEFSVHARGQLFQRGPFAAGLFTELGAGVGLGRRDTFFWNIGPVISLSFKNLVTASLMLWFQVYSDRICRGGPADRGGGETEPSLCNLTEGWPVDANDNTDDVVGPRDTSNPANIGRRDAPYQMVNGERKYLNPRPFRTHSLRDRFNGWKFYITFSVEVGITQWLNVFGRIDFVPAQASQQRALYMEYFTASEYDYDPDTARVTTKGVLAESDWGVHGRLGVSFKF